MCVKQIWGSCPGCVCLVVGVILSTGSVASVCLPNAPARNHCLLFPLNRLDHWGKHEFQTFRVSCVSRTALIIRWFSSSLDLDHEYELCEKHVGMLSVIRGINQVFKLHFNKHHMQLMLLLFKTRYESRGPSIICCMLLLMYNKKTITVASNFPQCSAVVIAYLHTLCDPVFHFISCCMATLVKWFY